MATGWGDEPAPSEDDGQQNDETGARPGPTAKRKRMSLANERATKAVHLRHTKSWTYQQIGSELGITPQAAKAAYERGVKMLVPREEVEEAKKVALAKLDQWEQMMLEEYYREIVMVNFGKVIYDRDPKENPDARPLLDYAHRQGIMDRLIKIERERQAILGYKAPSKRVLEVITADMFDKAIAQLNADAAALEEQARSAEDAIGLQALNPAQRELENSIIDAEVVEDDLPDEL